MKKRVYRERYNIEGNEYEKFDEKTYRKPYVEGEIVTDEFLVNVKDPTDKKVKRTIKKKSDK